MELDERFWAKVDKTDTCWLWTGATMTNGYGRLTRERKSHLAHRYAYELVVGPIPDGLVIDHLCRVTACVNPTHLEPVTQKENTARGQSLEARSKRAADQTHCAQGHERNAANTYWYRNYRRCRPCETRTTIAARKKRTLHTN